MSVNDQILDAIELLAKTSVERAGYDKTIQAQIISCQDPSIGKYKCKYQDATFYAYTGNSDIILTKGTFVYVLVPENDMSKEKTIVGTVDKLGIDYRSSAVGEEAYNIIGADVIQDNGTFYLDVDYKDYSYVLYNGETGVQDPDLHLNIQALNQYIKQASSLIIGMAVKTTIPQSKQKVGSYGIIFTLEFKDQQGHEGIQRTYILDENGMIDNPYNLVYPTRQYAIFDIDGQNFIKVKQIKIFNKDFPGSAGDSHVKLNVGEIELVNLEMKCAVRMSEEEINGLSLTVIAPQGTVFLDNDPKTLQAQVRFKGQALSAENVSFYWGLEDLQITPQMENYYNKYLGRGWKCINEKNIIQTEGGARSIQWISYGDTYIFNINQALVRDNKIKVAALYDGNVITRQVNIQNLTNSAGSIVINASAGTQFYYGVGETQLQCVVNIPGRVASTYAWGWQNNGGELQQLSTTVNIYDVEARYITNFAIFKCSAYDNGGNYLGTASIKITNSMQGEGTNPLVIQNGTVLYKYNEKGISPTSRTLQNPQIIEVLRFRLYDDAGNEITIFDGGLIDSRATVKWKVPKDKTLLRLVDTQTIDTTSDPNYNIVWNTETLTYDIAQRYDVRKTVNQIILQVTYSGATSFAQTNLTFTKQGQIGTNGTDYYVNVMPNTQMASPPLFPMITKFSNGNYKLNYGLDAYDDYTINPNLSLKPLLKVQFLHGGEPISSGYTVKWRVLKNRYGTQNGSPVEDESDFTINQSTGIMTYTGSLALNDTRSRANIIECEITYDSHIYYGAIPFITAYMTDESSVFDLVDGTGFHYVMYSSQGMQPEYSSLPFEFTDGNNGTCTVLGNTKIKNGSTWSLQTSGDLVQDSQDQFKIQPIGFYKGECVNNSVRYQNSDGIINIPVHFYLNRYNFAHLNGWDGNSIQINNEDGYILAPQMGAGKKQNDNSFTGVLMGQVKNPMKNQSNIGLFGYAQGERSFFINSENGSAIFGKSGNGEIIIDPGSNKAMLYSHNFWSSYNSQTGLPSSYSSSNEAGAGMLIDLTTPRIKFGNGGFSVDQDGNLSTGQGNFTVSHDGAINAGKRVDGQTTYYNFTVDTNGNVSFTGDLKAGRISSNKYNFFVDNTAQPGQNPKDKLLQAGWDNTNNKYNFVITADGDVTMAGDITANGGKIGGLNGWTIGSDNNNGWIYSQNRNTWYGYNNQSTGSLTEGARGLYIGTNGISAGNGSEVTFSIDANGNVYLKGSIVMGAGSSISWGALPNDVVAQGDLANVAFSGDYNDLDNQPDIPVLPSYIKSTYIDETRIESPTIYAGKYYATGQGYNNGAAYYIYDGHPLQSGAIQVGYISYDTHGTGGDAQNRVLFTTLNDTALKFYAGGNMSLGAGATNMGYFGTIYMQSDVLFSGNIRLKAVQYWGGINNEYHGTYGTSDPSSAFGAAVSTGQLYFKLK